MKKVLFQTLLFVLFNSLQAQTYNFVNYGVEEGLAQSQVQTIIQDDDHNLWIGTLAGLTKYNGKTFTTYTQQDGLAEDWITTSYKDKNGDIWFGHWAGGLSKYVFKLNRFENFDLENYTRYKTITSIAQGKRGRIWMTTEGSGVFVFDPVTNKMLTISKKEGTRSNNFYAVKIDSLNRAWLASDSGVVICNTQNDVFTKSDFVFLDKNKGLPGNHITSLALVNKNEIWIGTADHGVVACTIPGDAVLKTSLSPFKEQLMIGSTTGLNSNFIENIYEDSRHNVWIATTGGGVAKCQLPNETKRLNAIGKVAITNYGTRQGLNYFNANTVFEDIEGSIWIGTDLGLNQYRSNRFLLYNTADSLINNLVWSVLCDRDNNLWLGTNEGLSKITFNRSPLNGKAGYSVKNYTDKDGLTSNIILALHQDSSGNIWCGTGYGGVCKLPKGSFRFEAYTKTNGLASDVVYAITSDNTGNLWFGTKEGATEYSPVTKVFKNYTVDDSLGGNNIYRIFKDSKGNIWFGALGGELSMYDGKKIKRIKNSNGLAHRFILSINEDGNHNMWFGAYGGGLYKYDGNTFEQFTAKDGMSSNTPYSIIPDADNNIWIGHPHGIDKFDVTAKTFRSFSKPEGFMGVECNPNAIAKDKEGNIWFGTIMGAVKYTPAEDRQNAIEPKVLLTGLKIFMKDAPFPEDGKFTYNQNHLTFAVVGISLTTPRKVRYQYKLEGFDNSWSPGYTDQNEIMYSNLAPGKYTLLVQASNNRGLWSKEPLHYKFFIAPPFWQTTVFYILMIVILSFCLYGAFRIRNKNLNSAKRQLEEQVKALRLKNMQLEQKIRGEEGSENVS